MDKFEILRDSVYVSNDDLLHLGVGSNISNRSVGELSYHEDSRLRFLLWRLASKYSC